MIGVLVLGGALAVLVAIARLAAAHNTPFRAVIRYAMAGAGATVLAGPALITRVPVIGLALACVPGVIAYRRAHRYVTVRRPRTRGATLLGSRLQPVIGEHWSPRAMRIDYPNAQSAEASAVVVALPRNVLPSSVVDKCKTIVGETLGGGRWSAAVKGTQITFAPAERADPAALRHLKAVLLEAKALGAGGVVTVCDYDDEGNPTHFIARAARSMANTVASPVRQAHINNLLTTRVPLPHSGSWAIQWDVTGVPTLTARVSAFCERVPVPISDDFVTSKEQAAQRYPEAVFNVGVHETGDICTRTPMLEPNGITTGAPGKGKTTFNHVHITEAARWGFVTIIIDGKCSSSYVGFRDWPGVQILANDMYTIVRTIFYVAELLAHRQDGGRVGTLPVDDNVPVWVIIDEYADLMTRMQNELWDTYHGADPKNLPKKCPAITVVERLPQMIREFRIHTDMGTQKPDADRISSNIVFSSDKKSQWGTMSGAQSQTFWDDHHIGPSVPPIPGRGIIKTLEGTPRPVQGYYVPDPLKAHTRSDLEHLAALMPPTTLHRRIVFDMPDPATASWHDITSAPWYFAEDRPDLDPLSADYDPPPFLRYNTFGELNAATLDIDSGDTPITVDLDADTTQEPAR